MRGASTGERDPNLAGPATHVFVSPHYDDIALSCGGTVALLARRGLVPVVALLFGSEPDPGQPLSPFAVRLHREWGLDAGRVIAERRREEAAAAAILGARVINLPFMDAIYRGTHYESDTALFGDVSAAEAGLPDRIAAELRHRIGAPGDARLYVPLGIGNHVDHQIAFAAGEQLVREGYTVWFYEDLPYALRPDARENRLRRIEAGWRAGDSGGGFRQARLAPVARVDVSAAWNARIDAILSYASQVPTLFPPAGSASVRERISAALSAYAKQAGHDILSEQMWAVAGVEAGSGSPEKSV